MTCAKLAVTRGESADAFYLRLRPDEIKQEPLSELHDCTDKSSKSKIPPGEFIFKIKGFDINLKSEKSGTDNIDTAHPNAKRFKCEICNNDYAYKWRLKDHMRSHTGEKPFQCKICKATFSHKPTLRNHIRIHTKERPFQCKICKKSFSFTSALLNHMTTHTAQRPFACEICKKSFARKDHLQNHMNVHSKVKRFKCKVCRSKFSYGSGLVKHKKIHHPKKPIKYEIGSIDSVTLAKRNLQTEIQQQWKNIMLYMKF